MRKKKRKKERLIVTDETYELKRGRERERERERDKKGDENMKNGGS